VGGWDPCPTTAQAAAYTHIVIAFAVSYTWTTSGNICSPTCEIDTPPICNNAPNPSLVSEWQAAGKEVILGFGGAGMGGSWAGDNNDCWEQCYGRETQVTDRLVEIVNELGLDGVDLDFEYHVTPQAVLFLNQVTTGLRSSLPEGSEISHAPMDSDIIPGEPYYEDVLKMTGNKLDFLNVQYYNGITRPVNGINVALPGNPSTLSHYTKIVDDIFGGDPKRMIFGFCLEDCSGTASNVNGAQASTIMTDLATTYPCNGGAFLWLSDDDADGWSSVVGATMNNLALTGCSPSPTAAPQVTSQPTTPPPTPVPIVGSTPVPTTVAPTPDQPPTGGGGDPCCPDGFTGLKAWNDCYQFYHCVGGEVIEPIYDAPTGTLFDQNIQNANWANQVTCVVDNCGGRLRGRHN
jgi:hypothetical protein